MLPRTIATTILQTSETFPVLLVTGPRQVGKTTLLKSLAEPNRRYISLDFAENRHLAQNDPALFIQRYPAPLIIDEIQYAPELFSYIKIVVDNGQKNGLYWLTGSQKFHLMRNVSETLAGRMAILDMLGLSQRERTQTAVNHTAYFLPTENHLNFAEHHSKTQSIMDVYQQIWRGSFPRLWAEPKINLALFFDSYIETYLSRDVRDLTRVGDEQAFLRFLRGCASHTAQLLNISALSDIAGIDPKTAKAWLSILETSGLIYLLPPYHSNLNKRLVKTPKLYMLDTGLCAYLTRWSSAETLESGAQSGAMFETYVFTEILKSYWHNGLNPYLYFYRDKDQKEVDLLIDQDGMIYPIEFKKTASPSRNHHSNIRTLKLDKPLGPGGVICFVEQHIPLSREITAIPVGYL